MALLGLGHYIYIKLKNQRLPFKTILMELIIGTIILVVASVLTNVQTPPPPAPKAFDETIAAEGEKQKSIYEWNQRLLGKPVYHHIYFSRWFCQNRF